jgi:GGDEF domain-containing protein
MLAPYYLLAITALMFFIVILQSVQQEKIFVFKMILGIVYVFFTAIMSYVGLEQVLAMLGNNVYIGIQVYIYLASIILLYQAFKHATLKSNHYALFIKAIKNSKFNVYYIVDNQERIKDVSLGFLQEIALEKEDVIGKKLQHVLSKAIRIKSLDQKEATLKELTTYYQQYKKSARMHQADVQDITFLNAMGELTYFHFILQPVFVLGKYRGRVAIGEKKTDLEMLAVEKELEESNKELESIRLKFIATLELTEEGLFSINLLDETMWLSQPLTTILSFQTEEISLDIFKQRIFKEDVEKRDYTISKLSETDPNYEITYRIRVKEAFIWVREKGKVLIDGDAIKSIMGAIYEVKTKHFMNSDIPTLDEVSTYHHVYAHVKSLKEENKFFELLYVQMHNLPQINDTYGRDVGNLFISEYVKQLKKTFVSESGNIFRMSGSTFLVTITDPRKIDMLNKGMDTKGPFMDVVMNYGNIQTSLKVRAVLLEGSLVKDTDTSLAKMKETLYTLATQMRKETVTRLYD